MHKLLLDNNISHRVLPRIADMFSDATHVMLEELDESSDIEVWEFAGDNGYTIVTKDSDFNDLAIYRGAPPKIIWLRLGNCKVADIELLIKKNEKIIKNFIEEAETAILEI